MAGRVRWPWAFGCSFSGPRSPRSVGRSSNPGVRNLPKSVASDILEARSLVSFGGHNSPARPGFVAPHDRWKELEWRLNREKSSIETTGGNHGIRFQGQWQGGALRCTAAY